MTTECADGGPIEISEIDADGYTAAIPGLAALLIDAVEGGAAVNFLAGVTGEQAEKWWAERAPLVADGTITAFVARRPATVGDTAPGDSDIVGSTLLVRSRNQNSPHRAEIAKVIVHRSARRQGLGRALMAAAEARARADDRWLLLLDTEAGSAAEAFYRELGWQVLGTMPDHALSVAGIPSPTTFFWKDLRG